MTPETLTDDIELGENVDELTSEFDQTELNNTLLHYHDRKAIFESLEYRISKPYLEFLLNSTDMHDHKYWKSVLQEIARIYSLNIAKVYADGILSTKDFIPEIVRCLIYLKLNLISYIENQLEKNNIKITRSISRDEFENFLILDNAPEIVQLCIKYIDGDSYKKFINRIFLELSLNFME